MKQLGENALKAENQGWEWVGGGTFAFSEKHFLFILKAWEIVQLTHSKGTGLFIIF